MQEQPSPLLGKPAILAYVRQKVSKPSTYRISRSFGRSLGKGVGIMIAYKRAKTYLLKQTRFYHYAHAAGIPQFINKLSAYNPITLYGRFLKSLSPKVSAYALVYDNLIGLRPLYLLYMAYATHKGMQTFADLGTNRAFAVSLAIATAEVKVIASLAQFVRIPMRTFDAACLLPNVLKVNINDIDTTTRSGRLFAWSVGQAHKIVPQRITGELKFKNKISLQISAMTKATRRAYHKELRSRSVMPAPQ